MSWSPQQDAAIRDVQAWLKDPSAPQVFRLFGFAGTGKTTLARELAGDVRGKVLFGAFTGKAALVLRRKGCANASTIHSMIYKLDEEDEQRWQPKFILNPLSTVKGAKLVVIDECSMVGEELARDLLSFGVKVLVLGDPAQLPPVKDAGFFTNRAPDVMLTEVHRQAAENPIIRMSMDIRQGKRLQPGQYGDSRVISSDALGRKAVLNAGIVLAGRNATRRDLNAKIRALHGYDSAHPLPGERLVCLRNNKDKKLLNGGLWGVHSVQKIKEVGVELLVTSDDTPETTPTEIYVRHEYFAGAEEGLSWEQRKFTDEFTYGYCLTVHKSQGSQWDDVIVFDESSTFREDAKRWLYTGITRAAERVTVVA
ncbi:ATP-dependent RecD-like DNA helicase [Methylobacterium sp. PvR107]|uniref:ATP-dependent DNA helicase n=1 Tax=Methylobacterium sp. PvR107 TaxID=2806597 RepID=UPI001AE9C565|nr:AAA family ATPase [Methylobacterium sp. PvR107]MBP1180024.1 exodeoxyribonuclease-5 [Methylobacterium sp. PvR107]